MSQALRPTARSHAHFATQRIEHRGDAGDRLQLAFEQRPKNAPMALAQIGGQCPVPRFQIGDHASPADTGVALAKFGLGELDTAFGKAFPDGADRQQLAVDQDPVAIKNDKIPAHDRSSIDFGRDDDDRHVVDRAARQNVIAQAQRRLARRLGR